MARELELKYRAADAQFSRILGDHAGFGEIRMETVYFDTPRRVLAASRCTFRRRQENSRTVYTLKTPLPDGSRGEWELEADSLALALALLRQRSGQPVLEEIDPENLEPVCGARFLRRCLTLPIPGGLAELALDQGVLLGGGRELPLQEVELELKEGPDEALLAFGKQFQARYGLVKEPLSKFARAAAL